MVEIQSKSDVAIALQLTLVYLPLLYIPFRFIWWFRNTCYNNRGDNEQQPLLQQLQASVVVDPQGERDILIEQFRQETINTNDYDVIDEQI